MKKFNGLLLAVLLTIVAIVPNTAAAFADQPVAFVVFDNSGNVTQQVYKMWREPVRWAYHFPDFKLVDTDRTKKVTEENIFTGHGKSVVDQSVTRKIAEEIPAEALVLVIVHDMYEQMVQGMIWRNEDGSTYVRTVLNADCPFHSFFRSSLIPQFFYLIFPNPFFRESITIFSVNIDISI